MGVKPPPLPLELLTAPVFYFPVRDPGLTQSAAGVTAPSGAVQRRQVAPNNAEAAHKGEKEPLFTRILSK